MGLRSIIQAGCDRCGRVTQAPEGADIGNWTKVRVTSALRDTPRYSRVLCQGCSVRLREWMERFGEGEE